MTLTIQSSEDDLRQLTLTIEVDEDRVRKAMQKKARELSREVHLPGFRPGKAPYDVLVRRIGEDTLRAEAVEDLVQPVFEEALEQEGVDLYAQPSLENIELHPVTFKFIVPLSPTVVLGDYRAIRQDVEDVQVTDEALTEALEYVRMRHQVIEPVERAAEAGDVVTIGGRGKFTAPKPAAEGEEAATEGEMLFEEESLDLLLDDKTLFPDTPFVENLIGMSVGDQKEFTFVFPDPYEQDAEYAGREATFDVTVLAVKRRELPALDDELAKLEGKYETLDELREALRDDLAKEAEAAIKEKTIDDMIHHLIEDATMVYPPAAVEAQIDDMLEDFKNRLARSGWKYEDYLNLQGMTEENLRADFNENAEDQLRHQLALRQFILDEKLRVTAADVDELIDERIARFDNPGLRDSMRAYYRKGQGFDMISSEVLSNKAYERIRAIFSGNAPDLDALDEEAADEEE
ncbi:MAG TPA: trigger factor [Promineifilum sp.]|nr:trigger factor [Promineifilum sp.]HRO90022.1 trigger factor [Promineifilum sp.]HRQ14351.1 trigger factor [Promineifilum sp.]